MRDIEQSIYMENIVAKHKESLDRLTAYSVRGMLHPTDFVLELFKMQKQALTRCLEHLSEDEKERITKQLERLMKQ